MFSIALAQMAYQAQALWRDCLSPASIGYMKQIAILAALALPLAACVAPPPPDQPDLPIRAPEGECDAASAQDLIGQKADEEMGAILLERTGARQLRWAAPGMAVTMDYRPDRLTVSYDEDMIIERITCG